MRCLQCRSQLALLKKLTDGEFCSADHRTLFYDTQQKLIIQRLAESARKLQKYKVQSKAPAAPVPPPPVAEPVRTPKPKEKIPPIAAIVPVLALDSIGIRNYPYSLSPGFAAADAELVLSSPDFKRVRRQRRDNLAKLMPTFLGARAGTRRRQMEIQVDALRGPRVILPNLPNARRLSKR